MTFLSPWMLIGAAAVSIPIALHFFYRARYKPLPWAPMKFLKEAIEQTSRRLKFQEWILLALRCLAIILLALAIARPGCNTATVAGRGDAIDAMFVFDTSYSMDAKDANVTRLERAKDAALDVLKTLPANSSIQIFTCSDRATFIGPVQTHNLDQARNLIPNIEITGLASDLLPGLSEALTATKNGTAPAKEIYVFTDMQKEAFERQQGAIKAKCEEIKSAATLVFVRCGKADATIPNVAVQNVRWISPDVPHTRTRLPFVIDLKNTGTDTVKGLEVSLEIDGKKDAVQVDQLDKDQSYPVTLTAGLEQAGVSVISVRIDKDGLPGDNVLYKTILVRDKVRVLLVDGTPNPNLPTDAGDHFVKTALNPGRAGDYYIETESVSAAEASGKDLEGKDVVYLLNAPVRENDPVVGLSPDFLARLNEFVRHGGGLVIGSGYQVAKEPYNKALGSGGSGLLPFDLKDVRVGNETSPYRPAADTVDPTSFLAPFAKYADALQNVAMFRMTDVSDSGPGGRVLVTADGRPFIVSKIVGAGEVIMITGSLDERWGNFSSDPGSFHVPFARYVLTHLTGRKVSAGAIVAGNPIQWHVSPNPDGKFDEFELVTPPRQGEKTRQRVKLELGDANAEGKRPVRDPERTGLSDAASPRLANPVRPGLYYIVPVGKADTNGPVFTVNPELRETTNLTIASDEDLTGWLGFKPAIVQAGAGTEGAVEQLRSRSEWTEFVLVSLLLLLVVEAAWAWVCGRAW